MNKKRKGFSLIEVLVSLTIFGIVTVVGVNTFITSYRTTQQASVENVLLDDARFIMKRLEQIVRSNSIDYEEYFSRKVIGNGLPEHKNLYGQYHGLYNWQFFDGGEHPGTGVADGLGSWCQDADGDYHRVPNALCITGPLAVSEDNSTGQFPANQREPDSEAEVVSTTNSVCVPSDAGYFSFANATVKIDDNDCQKVLLADHHNQSELYLISPDGTKKTIIRTKKINDDQQVLSINEMVRVGESNNYDLFECAPDYPCKDLTNNDLRDPAPENNRGLYEDFVPLSPLRTNVKNVSFIIAPLEDPRTAFSENFPAVRMQPQVTILLTVEPAAGLRSLFNRQNLDLNLQTTVSSRVN